TDRIPLNCVVTVEPGVYLPGLGGFRIEDMVLAVRGGHSLLTRSPKGLIWL
ncbi:MAG: aminopeptidase, partial [Acidimicrobiia bacterium]